MRTLIAALIAIVTLAGVARAASDEEKCLAGRAKAKGKYEKCVADQLGKLWSASSALPESSEYIRFEQKLTRCRIKYNAAWAKLQRLAGSTTCGGSGRYVDNGDGTVTDNLTGLVWEKKSDNLDIHDWGAPGHTWSAGPSPFAGNGTIYTTFLRDGLNASSGFAGANDWRLPTLAELWTILLPEAFPCTTNPCVPPEFNSDCTPGCSATSCSCTAPGAGYWTSTTDEVDSAFALVVGIGDGSVLSVFKGGNFIAYRAVRGGL